MKDAPLSPDADAQARLAAKLAALALRPVAGTTEPSDAAVFGKTFAFGDNEKGLQTLSLKRDGGGVCLALRNAHGDQRINCGYGTWVAGEVIFEKPLTQSLNTTNGRQPVAASGAWAAPDRYVADVWFRETPYRVRMTLRFAGDNLDLDLDYNVMFGPQRKWSLRGHVAH